MNDTPGWVERVMSDHESRQAYERERLILSATEGIWGIMETKGFTRAAIGRALGKTRSNISQMLSGERNMTLKTLADLALACESRVHLEVRPVEMVNISLGSQPPVATHLLDTPPGDPPLAAAWAHAA